MEQVRYTAPRGQKTARAGGGRPAPLPEVAGWQGRLEQHVMEDLGSICPYVQILDLPVLQMVEQPEEVDSFFRNFVPAVAEAGYRSAQVCSSCLCCSARDSA